MRCLRPLEVALLVTTVLLATSVVGCGDGNPSAVQRPAIVWAVGDAADGGDQARAVADMIARSGRIDRLLYLGDVYENGTYEEFVERYEPLYGRWPNITSPTPGDHEWPNHELGYDRWWYEQTGRRPPHRTAVRLRGWEVISINSEQRHGPGSPQLSWLRSQVREEGSCRIFFASRPRFSASDRHGDQEDMTAAWNAIRNHAVIAIGGNDHNMQRLRAIDGIVQFVSGAGGRMLYNVRTDDRRLAFGSDDAFGALRLELRPGSADYAFVAADGGVLDKGTIRCRPLRP